MKHLIFLIDGTWMTPTKIDDSNTMTNIYKMNLLLWNAKARDGNDQIIFYTRGLGANSSLLRFPSGGFAWGIKETIEDVYMNIASNYCAFDHEKKSDKIYLFGFSRGAVIARVVAGLVGEVGLLKPRCADSFPEIWKHYKHRIPIEHNKKEFLCQPDAQIEFLGVFDTVYGGNKSGEAMEKGLQFTGKKLSKKVKNAVHIMSIDEQRPFFSPILWEDSEDHPNVQQIWMPGVHGDIGGCYPSNFFGLVSLLTMSELISKNTKIRLDKELKKMYQQNLIQLSKNINNEWSWSWKFLSLFDIKYWTGWLPCVSTKNRLPLKNGTKQILHPIVRYIQGANINTEVRGVAAAYSFPSEFLALPTMELEFLNCFEKESNDAKPPLEPSPQA